MIFVGMPVVFPQGTGKIVTTGKITFGTEKHIIVVLIIQSKAREDGYKNIIKYGVAFKGKMCYAIVE